MNFELVAVQLFGATQCLKGGGILLAFEVNQAQPVLELRVIWPVRHRLASKLFRVVQAPGSQIAPQQAAISSQASRRQRPHSLAIPTRILDAAAIQRSAT